jgi:hypothetical protein
MQRLGLRRLGALLSLVLVFGVLAAGLSFAQARQGGTREDGPGTPRPGHIHVGSCANLGDVDYALNNATIDNLNADYSATGLDYVGSNNALPAYISQTTVDVSLDEILSSEHAINFHLSGPEAQTYIACGDLGGYVHDGVLYVGLAPATGDSAYSGDSQFAGTAVLTDNGDNTTDVVVQLVELPVASGSTTTTTTTTGAATPASTPIVTLPVASVSPSAMASSSASASASTSASASASASASVAPSASASGSGAPSESAVPSEAASASSAPSDVALPSAEASDIGAPSDIAAPSASAAA